MLCASPKSEKHRKGGLGELPIVSSRLCAFSVGCPRATHVALSFQFFSKTHRNVRETVLSGFRNTPLPRRVTNVIEWPGSADQLDVFLLSPFGRAYLFGRASQCS